MCAFFFPSLFLFFIFVFSCTKHSPCNCSAMQLPVTYHRVEFELPAYFPVVDAVAAVEFAFGYFADHHFHRVCHHSVPIIHDILHFVHCVNKIKILSHLFSSFLLFIRSCKYSRRRNEKKKSTYRCLFIPNQKLIKTFSLAGNPSYAGQIRQIKVVSIYT